jgi:hypothetical protein
MNGAYPNTSRLIREAGAGLLLEYLHGYYSVKRLSYIL